MTMSVISRWLSVVIVPFFLALLSAILCYLVTGPTLGIFIGGLFIVTLLAPPLAMANTGWDRLAATCFIALAISGVWFYGCFHSESYISEWLTSTVVLIAYAIGLAGISAGPTLARCSAIVSAAIATVIGLFWMTWPIWASHTWSGEDSAAGVARLVMIHPGMAINGQVSKLGAWSGQSIAYHLTDLQQNVMYSLPRHIWPCVLLHVVVGAGLLALAAWVEGRGVAVRTCPSIVQMAPSATDNKTA